MQANHRKNCSMQSLQTRKLWTGAGDCFTAAYAVSTLEGTTTREALHFAGTRLKPSILALNCIPSHQTAVPPCSRGGVDLCEPTRCDAEHAIKG
jgi:pyridoxal/pyridoxine/pyridoxamine kinase